MATSGRGRYYRANKKVPVEDCLFLDVNILAKRKCFVPDIHSKGSIRWFDGNKRKKVASCHFEVYRPGKLDPMLQIRFSENGQAIDQTFRLQATRPHFGGERWCFLCPCGFDGDSCNRRVGKLYLPPGEDFFGCRHCHDLTYLGSQKSSKFMTMVKEVAQWTNDPILSHLSEVMTRARRMPEKQIRMDVVFDQKSRTECRTDAWEDRLRNPNRP